MTKDDEKRIRELEFVRPADVELLLAEIDRLRVFEQAMKYAVGAKPAELIAAERDERIRELEREALDLRAYRDDADYIVRCTNCEKVEQQLKTSQERIRELEQALGRTQKSLDINTDDAITHIQSLEQQLKSAQERLMFAEVWIRTAGLSDLYEQQKKEYFAKHSPSSGNERG